MRALPQGGEEWSRIAPYLDQALDLEPSQQSEWLAELTTIHPDIAASVRDLLAERELLRAKNFLDHPPLASMATKSRAGTQVGGYTVERMIGQGGMGEVWLAKRSDDRFEGLCAIKFLNASFVSSKLADRFRREGHILARLTHPHVARLLDAGAAEDGTPYLALEYVDGQRIDRYCDECKLSISQRVRMFLDVIDSVAHAHSHLIIHRDLKPSNVLVTAQGQVKLLDFGIAKLLSADQTAADGYTRMEDALFTPEYAAPEQMLGELPSTATDVYQLGMLLYVLLAGTHPLKKTETRAQQIRSALDGTIPLASELADPIARKQLRGDLDAILAMALRKTPSDRYATAKALHEELLRYLHHEPVLARRGAKWYRARKFIARHRVPVAASTLAVVSLCAALVFAHGQAQEATRQRDQARSEAKRADAEARFMTLMMSDIGTPGTPVTPETILAKGLRLIEAQHGDDPKFVIQMLAKMASRFFEMDNQQQAHDAYLRAEKIAVNSGDLLAQASINCALVHTELALKRVDRATERLAAATKILEKEADADSIERVGCLNAEAAMNIANGQLQDARRHLEQSIGFLEASGNTSTLDYSVTLAELATLYASLGEIKLGYEFSHRSRVSKEQQGYGETLGALTAMHNEAMALWNLGELRAAFELETKVLNRRMARDSAEKLTPGTCLGYGSMLARLDRASEALVWIDRGEEAARRGGYTSAEVYVQMQRAKVLFALDRLEQTESTINRAIEGAKNNEVLFREPITRVMLLRADVLMRQHRVTQARQLVDSLLAQINDPQKGLDFYRGIALLLASRVASEEGRFEDADSHATAALQLNEARSRDPLQSADVGEAALQLAKVKSQRNDRDAALTLTSRAVTAFRNSVGNEHSSTQAALEFESELRR